MANSFIKYKNYGFWINDPFMEVALAYIVNELQKVSDKSGWLEEFEKNLLLNSQGYYPSYMHLHLDKYVISEDRKKFLVDILKSTNSFLKKKGKFISAQELNAFIVNEELQFKWPSPLETARIVKVIDSMINLIEGRVTTKADDPIDYDF